MKKELKILEAKIEDYDLASQKVWKGHWLSQYFERQRDERIKEWEALSKRTYTLKTKNAAGFSVSDGGGLVGNTNHTSFTSDTYSPSCLQGIILDKEEGGIDGNKRKLGES